MFDTLSLSGAAGPLKGFNCKAIVLGAVKCNQYDKSLRRDDVAAYDRLIAPLQPDTMESKFQTTTMHTAEGEMNETGRPSQQETNAHLRR